MNNFVLYITSCLLLLTATSLPAKPPIWQIKLINSFPAPDSKTEIFQGVAIDIDFESNLYIVDRGKHQLLKFDRNGRLIKSIGGFGEGEEQFDDPRDVYAQKTVNVYVADYNNNRVVRYDKNLNFINALSSRWPPPFQFDRVLSIAVSSQSDLFLLEDGEKKVIKFNRFSEPAEAFGGIHETYGQLLEPVKMTLDNSRRLFISDPAQSLVVVFDYLGNFITHLSHPKLKNPSGIHWGQDRKLYIVNPSTAEIFTFSENLKLQGIISLKPQVSQIVDLAVEYKKETQITRFYGLSRKRCWVFSLQSPGE